MSDMGTAGNAKRKLPTYRTLWYRITVTVEVPIKVCKEVVWKIGTSPYLKGGPFSSLITRRVVPGPGAICYCIFCPVGRRGNNRGKNGS